MKQKILNIVGAIMFWPFWKHRDTGIGKFLIIAQMLGGLLICGCIGFVVYSGMHTLQQLKQQVLAVPAPEGATLIKAEAHGNSWGFDVQPDAVATYSLADWRPSGEEVIDLLSSNGYSNCPASDEPLKTEPINEAGQTTGEDLTRLRIWNICKVGEDGRDITVTWDDKTFVVQN